MQFKIERSPPIRPKIFCGLTDSRTHMLHCVGKEQSIPAVGESPQARDSAVHRIPPIQSNDQQSTQFLRQADIQVLLCMYIDDLCFC